MLKKLNKILFLILLMVLTLSVSAFASGEPSGEPSAEPAAASGEPSAEPAAEEVELSSFDVTINVNGDEYVTVAIGASVEGNTYTFQIAELLEALGINLVYDEQTDVATMTAEPNSLMAVFMMQLEAESGASDEPVASGEPSAEPGTSDEPAASGEPSGEPAAAASGEPSGEPAEAAAPAGKEEFEAYVSYLREYMTSYDGVGDGTFDESARMMALGELDSVGFGADVNAFPFEMYVSQFGAKDYANFAAGKK